MTSRSRTIYALLQTLLPVSRMGIASSGIAWRSINTNNSVCVTFGEILSPKTGKCQSADFVGCD